MLPASRSSSKARNSSALVAAANEGQLALGIVVGPQQVAGGPKLDDGGEILVAVAAEREGHDSADFGSEGFGSTGVSPGRPHSAQEPS